MNNGIKVEVLGEADHGTYVVRRERWTADAGPPIDFEAAWTLSGDLIGTPEEATRLCDELGIAPEKLTPRSDCCSVGFSAKEQKWYGWSHRMMASFGIGSVASDLAASEELPKGAVARTIEDARKMAFAFAEDVS